MKRTAIGLLFLGLACHQPPPSETAEPGLQAQPAPTEHRLGAEAEGENREARERWLEAKHRTAPGVDWRAIERENQRRALEKRRQLLQNRSARGTSPWIEVGSRNQAGSTVATVPSTDKQVIYAGSALGGLWVSPPDGSQWTPIGDNYWGGAYDLAVIPAGGGQQDILLVTAGATVLRSTDGGTTWVQPSGFPPGLSNSARPLVLQDASHTVVMLARGSSWGVYRSTDQGASFTKTRDIGGNRGDLWTPRDRLDKVYLSQGDRVYESSNQGLSFTSTGIAIPVSGIVGETRLAGHENPEIRFNVATRTNGTWELWRSKDAGQSWTYRGVLTDFWGQLEASSTAGELVTYGGVELWVSRNAGATFHKVNNWGAYYGDPANKLHADIMSIDCYPDPSQPMGEIWYIGCHGGTYHSLDRMDTVENLSLQGLGVSQYYSTHTSRRNPSLLLSGSQDQGYQRGVLGSPGGTGPYADFDQLISGDYGHLSSADGSHDLVYCDYPGFILVQEGEDNPQLHSTDFPAGSNHQWLPFITADPTDKNSFYFCGDKLWRGTRIGTTGDWSYVQHSSYDFSPAVLTALAFSPLDSQRAYAATNYGELFWSDDGGVNWTLAADPGPGAHYFYGNAILCSSTDVDTVWIGGSGYSSPPVKRSTDGGRTWHRRRQGLPDTLVFGLAEATDQSGAIYAAAEAGAFRWEPSTNTWEDLLGVEAPLTLYWSVESVPANNLIRFGTYGRGVWDYVESGPGLFPYGELAGGVNSLKLYGHQPPLIGQSLTLITETGPAFASGVLAYSQSQAETPGYGGTVFIDAAGMSTVPFTTDATGQGIISLSLPNNPALIGQERFLQAGIQDPSQPGGWLLSHGLRARIGS